jgi:hypothetical protein
MKGKNFVSALLLAWAMAVATAFSFAGSSPEQASSRKAWHMSKRPNFAVVNDGVMGLTQRNWARATEAHDLLLVLFTTPGCVECRKARHAVVEVARVLREERDAARAAEEAAQAAVAGDVSADDGGGEEEDDEDQEEGGGGHGEAVGANSE